MIYIFVLLFILLCTLVSCSDNVNISANSTLEYELLQQQTSSFYQCQSEAIFIRQALSKFNVSLPNIPSQLVSNNNISFLLFTRKFLAAYPLIISNGEVSIRSSGFKADKPTVIFADGYALPSIHSANILPKRILSAEDVNLIIVNWDSYNTFNLHYTRNITVPLIGKIVADFVYQLIAVGANPKEMYFIGFSAGAEILGLAAKRIQPKIAKLLGLDPQGSCYNYLPSSERIDKSDADFVSIAHCSVGMRALPLDILGDVTFYINGGYYQDSCLNRTDLVALNTCSHGFCEKYFFDGLLNFGVSFGLKCQDYQQYLRKQCDCHDKLIYGYYTPSTARGLYFIDEILYKSSTYNPNCTYSMLS